MSEDTKPFNFFENSPLPVKAFTMIFMGLILATSGLAEPEEDDPIVDWYEEFDDIDQLEDFFVDNTEELDSFWTLDGAEDEPALSPSPNDLEEGKTYTLDLSDYMTEDEIIKEFNFEVTRADYDTTLTMNGEDVEIDSTGVYSLEIDEQTQQLDFSFSNLDDRMYIEATQETEILSGGVASESIDVQAPQDGIRLNEGDTEVFEVDVETTDRQADVTIFFDDEPVHQKTVEEDSFEPVNTEITMDKIGTFNYYVEAEFGEETVRSETRFVNVDTVELQPQIEWEIGNWREIGTTVACNSLTTPFVPSCTAEVNLDYSDEGTVQQFVDDAEISWEFDTENINDALMQTTNEIERTEGMANAEAKTTAIESLNNGTSESEAIANTNEDIGSHFSDYELRIYREHHTLMLKLQETMRSAERTDITENSNLQELSEFLKAESGTVTDVSFVEEEIELYNGDKHEILTVEVEVDNGDLIKLINNEGNFESPNNEIGFNFKEFEDSNAAPNSHINFEVDKKIDAINAIEDARSRSLDNNEEIVGEIYTDFEQGDLTVDDVLGAQEMVQQASTSYEDTGHYSYAAASLEKIGLATNKSQAFEIEVDDANKTVYEGQLFGTEDAFPEGIELNEEYTIDTGDAWITAQKEEGAENINLQGETFTVTDMTDVETGETVEQTEIEETEIFTPETDELEQQVEELRALQDELEQNHVLGFGGLGNFNLYLLGILALLIAFIYIE